VLPSSRTSKGGYTDASVGLRHQCQGLIEEEVEGDGDAEVSAHI
jgi:hypothetical protein